MDLSWRNIEHLVKGWDESFRSSGNPFYAWMAIHFCIKFKKPLPRWVIAYLGECTGRMMSKGDASDLRRVLPEILGFPKKGRGPGKLLNPGPSTDKVHFTRKFMNYILRGDDPKTARHNACNDMSREFADKYSDDKALVKILVECTGLPEAPHDTQWKRLIFLWVGEDIAEQTLWDASATDEDRARAREWADKMWKL